MKLTKLYHYPSKFWAVSGTRNSCKRELCDLYLHPQPLKGVYKGHGASPLSLYNKTNSPSLSWGLFVLLER